MKTVLISLMAGGAMMAASPLLAQSTSLDDSVAKVGTQSEASADTPTNKRDGRKPAEIEATRGLNAEAANKAKSDVAAIQAQQEKYKADVAAYEAATKAREEQIARDKAEYDARMADYNQKKADWDACVAGDKARCAVVAPPPPPAE